VFGEGYAAANPDVAVMLMAATDFAALTIAGAMLVWDERRRARMGA
jgi:hypothetical protein